MGTLIDQDKISDPVASFKLEMDTTQSEVLIGGIDDSAYTGEIVYNDLELTTWWTLSLDGVWAGDTDIYDSETKYAIVDTGTSFMYLSQSDYLEYVTQLQNADSSISCSTDYCESTLNQCSYYDGKAPDIILQLGRRQYTIPVAGYTIPAGVFGSKCIFAVSSIPNSQNMYILGDTFIRNFYSVFDYQRNQIGLAVSASAPEGVSISDFHLTGWEIAAIVLLCILFLVCVILCVLKCIKKRKAKKQLHGGIRIGGATTNGKEFSEVLVNSP